MEEDLQRKRKYEEDLCLPLKKQLPVEPINEDQVDDDDSVGVRYILVTFRLKRSKPSKRLLCGSALWNIRKLAISFWSETES